MRAVDIIRKKRDGGALSGPEIEWMVQGIARGDVADYQWSALLMAIVLKGMDDAETATLTEAMMRSGEVVDLGMISGPKIDKHSTGGVGDKTSLIAAPVAAAVGVLVPMVSGRGLGHTGGTLDKLESIPGFRVDLDLTRYRQVLEECGLVMIGQTAEIAPADKYLYALRDATATVESIPLITASIMSKKLSEGIDGLVLDVKTGDGAFLRTRSQSMELAQGMCRIGQAMGKRVAAMVTNMDQPLGRAVGNAVEVAESIACLRGEGPQDLMSLSLELAASMVLLGERVRSMGEARTRCRAAIDDGRALERFQRMIAAQGGDPRVVDEPDRLPRARKSVELPAPRAGIVQELAASAVGRATMLLGAGRARMDSAIDPAVGVWLHKKMGDAVSAGEPLCTILANDEARLDAARDLIARAYRIDDPPFDEPALILHRWD